MRTINNLLQAVEKTSIETVCGSAVNATKEPMLTLNKQQLYDGKTRSGNDLSPTYLEDPYFKSREAAQRYSDWKDEITPNPKRKKGVPNLFIVGAFHNSIGVKVMAGNIEFSSSFPKAQSIEEKFTEGIYGLGGEYKGEYLVKNLAPAVNTGLIENLNKR